MKIQVDGYAFGGLRLDGIFFNADCVAKEVADIVVAPECDGRHWSEMDQDKWLGTAKQYVQDLLEEFGSAQAVVDACEADPVMEADR